ncbi:MAG: NADH:flavin oxidoreductase [Alphaproteobacteria bacterium]|nr:NADH:flavin oxidoreductase [Alphaproteobacteria bacterium]
MLLSGPGVDKFPTLFSGGDIRGVKMSNRGVVSPMTRTSATEDGIVTDQMAKYYASYARGGWGLIMTEGVYIDLKYSQGYTFQSGIATDEQRDSWRKVVDVVHAEGVPIFMQLFHCGAINQGNRWVEGSIAPSVVKPKGEQIPRYRGGAGGFQTPREITRDEMAEIVESYAAAARRAIEVGFDGVEVHGANGYLPDEFLTVYANQRDDEYGGTIENRIRYHCEIMQAVRDAVPDHPVGVRISQTKVNDFEYAWPGGDDDAKVVFSSLAKTGIDFLDCSSHLGLAPIFGTENSLSGLARKYSGLPVMANGKLDEPESAEAALTRGEGDFVAIGKSALADHSWPAKIAAEEPRVPFNPGMTMPYATLDCYEAFWAENPTGIPKEKIEARDVTEGA